MKLKNFYYVLTPNVSHPHVKTLLDKIKIIELSDSMIDFKIRSKLYLSYTESVIHVHDDIKLKLSAIFPEIEEGQEKSAFIKVVSLMNPHYAIMSEISQKLAEKFGNLNDHWDENCCSAIFLSEGEKDEEEDDIPKTWMFKYEIFYVEDPIEICKNGEYAFAPSAHSSTYQ